MYGVISTSEILENVQPIFENNNHDEDQDVGKNDNIDDNNSYDNADNNNYDYDDEYDNNGDDNDNDIGYICQYNHFMMNLFPKVCNF